jgi:AcrR family transcriptional regulator
MSSSAREDPRVTRTRQLILQAFTELIKEKGFESLTVQEIADRATVNRATFYAHFADKYVLLDSAFAEEFKKQLYARLSPDAEFTPMNLQLLIQTACELLVKTHARCAPSGRMQFDAGVGQRLNAQVYEFLLAWITKRDGGRNHAELRATITSWAIYGAARRWSEEPRQASVQEFAHQALPLIMAGLEAPLRVHSIAHAAR